MAKQKEKIFRSDDWKNITMSDALSLFSLVLSFGSLKKIKNVDFI